MTSKEKRFKRKPSVALFAIILSICLIFQPALGDFETYYAARYGYDASTGSSMYQATVAIGEGDNAPEDFYVAVGGRTEHADGSSGSWLAVSFLYPK